MGEASERADGGKSGRIVQRTRGMRLDQLEVEAAEMFRKPRPPGDAQAIAGLKQRPKPARPPSPHEAEMAAMAKREQLGDGVRFAEGLRAEEDAFVAPVHESLKLRSIPSDSRGPSRDNPRAPPPRAPPPSRIGTDGRAPRSWRRSRRGPRSRSP